MEAEKQLLMPFNNYGSYLVRDSETTPGDFSLSVRDRERVRHYRIKKLENGTFFVTRRVTFESIVDLVVYYQQQADGLCVNLISPCDTSAPLPVRRTGFDAKINKSVPRIIIIVYLSERQLSCA